jgi:hypothetical protein
VCTQDEMIELQEREEQAAVEEKLGAEKATHDELMKEANLDGVESLIDDMVSVGGTRVLYCCARLHVLVHTLGTSGCLHSTLRNHRSLFRRCTQESSCSMSLAVRPSQ